MKFALCIAVFFGLIFSQTVEYTDQYCDSLQKRIDKKDLLIKIKLKKSKTYEISVDYIKWTIDQKLIDSTLAGLTTLLIIDTYDLRDSLYNHIRENVDANGKGILTGYIRKNKNERSKYCDFLLELNEEKYEIEHTKSSLTIN